MQRENEIIETLIDLLNYPSEAGIQNEIMELLIRMLNYPNKVAIQITSERISMRDGCSSFNFYERKIENVDQYEALFKMLSMYKGKWE